MSYRKGRPRISFLTKPAYLFRSVRLAAFFFAAVLLLSCAGVDRLVDETQKSLTENLFDLFDLFDRDRFWRRGGRWLTAAGLVEAGLRDIVEPLQEE